MKLVILATVLGTMIFTRLVLDPSGPPPDSDDGDDDDSESETMIA